MLEPIPYATPLRGPILEKNRRGGLIVFGVVTLLGAALSGCFTGMIGLASVFTFGTPPGALEVLFTLASSGAFTILALALGISSIRCRRWVRPVILGLAWPVMVGTLLLVVMLAFFWADLDTRKPFARMTEAGVVFSGAFMVLFGVVMPLAYIWFYSGRHVRLTLEAYDPLTRWTDRAPLPVFIAGMASLLAGLMTLALTSLRTAPFFGRYVSGAGSIALTLGAAGALLASAVLLFRMHAAGWWLALLTTIAGFTSAIVTFARLGMMEFYRRGQFSPADLELLKASRWMNGLLPIVMSTIALAGVMGYLLHVHRYFCRRRCSNKPYETSAR